MIWVMGAGVARVGRTHWTWATGTMWVIHVGCWTLDVPLGKTWHISRRRRFLRMGPRTFVLEKFQRLRSCLLAHPACPLESYRSHELGWPTDELFWISLAGRLRIALSGLDG